VLALHCLEWNAPAADPHYHVGGQAVPLLHILVLQAQLVQPVTTGGVSARLQRQTELIQMSVIGWVDGDTAQCDYGWVGGHTVQHDCGGLAATRHSVIAGGLVATRHNVIAISWRRHSTAA